MTDDPRTATLLTALRARAGKPGPTWPWVVLAIVSYGLALWPVVQSVLS